MKVIRLEKRDNKTYAFIKVVNGDSANAEEIVLSSKQREAIEAILNSEIEEHDIVVVTEDVIANSKICAGDIGTVIHVHEENKAYKGKLYTKTTKAYEVEFTEKKLVLTMYPQEIKKKIK